MLLSQGLAVQRFMAKEIPELDNSSLEVIIHHMGEKPESQYSLLRFSIISE
jgi:hypothetical protein